MTSRVAINPKTPRYDRTSGRVGGRFKKPPSFRGRHNQNRALVLLALDDYYKRHDGQGEGLSVRELASITGRPLDSIASTVKRWVGWKFMGRHYAMNANGRLVFHYRIWWRGRKWIERHMWRFPLERWQAELQDHLQSC